ncbi:MAG: helix-turn-helix domain-containing protein [Pseudomonadales bacterium]|mgnify:CR=1 FL=1|jgi:sugar-specific transcriptional regulator TrmB|nr:TrmB family transcriptional regulator [Gammaproteobacteria bacterium]|tara:strand:- start:3981 stop:4781 length:801 start_codon:yes stop_codon:yes gene_type:complete
MDACEQLKSLGFTTNEAKSYLALLQCQPATAYEIAKTAGLPTSKIYETVARLVSRAVLLASEDETGTQQYYALNPSDLMQSIRNNIIKDTEQLLPELQKVPTNIQSNLIWPLLNSNQVERRTLEIINQATTSILVSLWPEELDWCEESLVDAEARGVNIALVHFGEPSTKIGATYHHPVQETLYAEKGGRGLTVVVDGAQVVIANFQSNGEIDGAWSKNKSFVTVAEDYVKHDVYITKVTRFLGPEVVKRFGENYDRLRDVFNSEA